MQSVCDCGGDDSFTCGGDGKSRSITTSCCCRHCSGQVISCLPFILLIFVNYSHRLLTRQCSAYHLHVCNRNGCILVLLYSVYQNLLLDRDDFIVHNFKTPYISDITKLSSSNFSSKRCVLKDKKMPRMKNISIKLKCLNK